jgi:hypothetical protein
MTNWSWRRNAMMMTAAPLATIRLRTAAVAVAVVSMPHQRSFR